METALPILFLVQIAGAAALLIWAVRLVRTGVERAYSVPLRRWLRLSARSRPLGMATGAAAALALQSSTAVAILVATFAAAGTIAAAPGLAIVIGSDVGSALVTQLLLLRQAWLAPVLLLIGVALFLRGQGRTVRQGGRILVGLALIFVSLDMIRAATEPLRDASGLSLVLGYLDRDAVTAFVIGAAFAWLVHSSVAAVLLFVTLAAQGILLVPGAVAMVLGANFGGAMIATILTLGAPVEARRIITANLVLRGGGAALALIALRAFQPDLSILGGSPERIVINLHLAFNLALALLSLPVIGLLCRAMRVLIREPRSGVGLPRQTALDPAALDNPDRALACAARELLRMGEDVEAMLRPVIGLYAKWDDAIAAAISGNEAAIDKMHLAIKLYLARLNRADGDADIARRCSELSTTAANLEAASDAVSRNLVDLARRLQDGGLSLSDDGGREIRDFHDRVLANVQLALSVMMTGDVEVARELVEEKDNLRDVEQALQRSHLGRLREGVAESIETSNIHQETLRALKQINSAFTVVAYPILTESGDLLSSRLAGGGGN